MVSVELPGPVELDGRDGIRHFVDDLFVLNVCHGVLRIPRDVPPQAPAGGDAPDLAV